LSSTFSPAFEALLIVLVLSTDSFVASFAYGSNKIKIPFSSVMTINLICSCILGVSLLVGTILRGYIQEDVTRILCFTILMCLGLIKIFDSTIKRFIRTRNDVSKELKFSMLNLNFILNIYANPQEADRDSSRILSPFEAASLALALSLDGLAVGFGAVMGDANPIQVFVFSLFSDLIAVPLGCYLGNKVARKTQLDLTWLGGTLLIAIAFMKL